MLKHVYVSFVIVVLAFEKENICLSFFFSWEVINVPRRNVTNFKLPFLPNAKLINNFSFVCLFLLYLNKKTQKRKKETKKQHRFCFGFQIKSMDKTPVHGSATTTDPSLVQPKPMTYVCGECHKDNDLKSTDVIRCKTNKLKSFVLLSLCLQAQNVAIEYCTKNEQIVQLLMMLVNNSFFL